MSLKSFIPKYTLTGLILPYAKNYIKNTGTIIKNEIFDKEYEDKFCLKNNKDNINVNINVLQGIKGIKVQDGFSEFRIKTKLNLVMLSNCDIEYYTEEIYTTDVDNTFTIDYKLFKNNKYITKIKTKKNKEYFLNEFEYKEGLPEFNNILLNSMFIYYNN
jgi:hypothetical protein